MSDFQQLGRQELQVAPSEHYVSRGVGIGREAAHCMREPVSGILVGLALVL